jgi:hypothetical protein
MNTLLDKEVMEGNGLVFVRAKTMPHVPHQYVVRKPHNEQEFLALFDAIQEHGIYEMWANQKKKYWYRGDGWKYWTMTTHRPSENIVNRQKVLEPVTSKSCVPPRRREPKS